MMWDDGPPSSWRDDDRCLCQWQHQRYDFLGFVGSPGYYNECPSCRRKEWGGTDPSTDWIILPVALAGLAGLALLLYLS